MKKTLFVLISSLVFSLSAFSAETFSVTGAKAKSLLALIQKSGAQNLGTVGSLNIGVLTLHCSTGMTIAGPIASQRKCNMVDKYSNANLELKAVDAKAMYDLLKKIGVKPTITMDAVFIEATEISCSRVVYPGAKPKCTVRE